MVSDANTTGAWLEMGKLYFERGDFDQALDRLSKARHQCLLNQEIKTYLKSTCWILRIHAEREDFEAIEALRQSLVDQKLMDHSRLHYALGLCAFYQDRFDEAQAEIAQSIDLALKDDQGKEDLGYALSGRAILHACRGEATEALKDIKQIQVLLDVFPNPDLMASTLLLEGHVLRLLKRHSEAQEIYWQAYERLQQNKNLFMYVSLLYALGKVEIDLGNFDAAKMYLRLAQASADPKSLKHCRKIIDRSLEQILKDDLGEYDIVFDESSKVLKERQKGKVSFNNQFILLDLLRLFIRNPGRVYSKETLVHKVWKQDYDPSVHDNKIYVTIKRLRKMIEPNYEKPKYIFRAKNGYYLDQHARVLLDN